MKQLLPLLFLAIAPLAILAQRPPKIKTVDELVNYSDPGWKALRKQIDTAINKVEIMPVDTNQARLAIYETQISTESPLGTIVYMTGGLLFEDGWIRLLGSGSNRLTRSISTWNKGKTITEIGERPPYLLIADDALGGFFALNLGGLGNSAGKVFYLAPATLQWQNLEMTIPDFLHFCFDGDFEEFYKPYMSKSWHFEVTNLPADKCYNYSPPLWSKEGKKFAKSVRRFVPCEEQYNINMKLRKQFHFDEDDKEAAEEEAPQMPGSTNKKY